MLNLTEKDWQIVGFMVRLGAYTTLASLPIGIVAIRRYPNYPMVPVVLIGIVAIVVRSLMNGSFVQNYSSSNL